MTATTCGDYWALPDLECELPAGHPFWHQQVVHPDRLFRWAWNDDHHRRMWVFDVDQSS